MASSSPTSASRRFIWARQKLEQLKRGEIAALALAAGKPARSMANPQLTEGLHLLPVPSAKAFRLGLLHLEPDP
jgi:hypothetical protein